MTSPPNFSSRNISTALPGVLGYLLDQGHETGSRNGRTVEALNAKITLMQPWEREVLCINRKANVYAQIAETMWVLAGRNDIGWLSAYLPRAADYSDDGIVWRGGYGPRIRGTVNTPDQLTEVVEMLKADPLSRRAVISIYEADDTGVVSKDIPCNTQLQFQSRLGELHLTVTVRSNDAMWGWSGINAFEWSTLQEIVASMLGITTGTLTFNIGSLHLYEQHWKKARSIHHEDATYRPLRFNTNSALKDLGDVDLEIIRWFAWEDRCREGSPTEEGLEMFQEPLFYAWAKVIAHYWTGDDKWLEGLGGTALLAAVVRTPRSLLPSRSEPSSESLGAVVGAGTGHGLPEPSEAFYAFVTDLHAKKHATYGDSWRRRGEVLSILANIARKVDRLGVGDEFDSAADTLIDLMVYTAKYLNWLRGGDDTPENVNILLLTALRAESKDRDLVSLIGDWDRYMDDVIKGNLNEEQQRATVTDLLLRVTPMAVKIWAHEQGQGTLFDVNDNPPCRFCGGLKSNHVPGGSRWSCQSSVGFQADTDDYRGADVD